MLATIASTPITINNTKINNLKEPYPFLRYKDVTYFPLTYKFTKEEFNIYMNYLPEAGLGVYSENKFFYQYYKPGSKHKSTDLRISSILYLMTAINISDGTGKYPSNNIKQYDYERPGIALSPNYKDIKYYGYLPDGNGGLKANVESKLNIGELITTEISNLENPNPIQVQLSFSDDGLGRLTKEAESGTADAITKSYTFDAASNRASMTVSGAEAYKVGYKYDLNNRLTAENKDIGNTEEITDYYYDNNGNTIAKQKGNLKNNKGNKTLSLSLDFTGSELYSYDGFDRMTGVQNSSGSSIYTYKPDGLRISKTVNGVKTTQVWEGQDIALEQDGNGEVTNRYIRGIGLISSDKNGWYLFNAHGDAVQLTDGSGNVSKEYSYDAFGNEKNIDANDSNLFRYCGEYFDKETGDIYLRARYYNPEIGRFISEDSVTGNINDPLTLNLYTYCENNPIMFVDPTGNWKEGDGSLSYNAQRELLKLTYDYYNTNNTDKRAAIGREADLIRTADKKPESSWSKFWHNYNNSGSKSIIELAKDINRLPHKRKYNYYADLGYQIMQREYCQNLAMGISGEGTVIAKGARNIAARMTTKQATAAAKALGYKETNYFSKGQPVFKKGNRYITPDVDRHNGGVWKMADSVSNLSSKRTRMGTFDANLKEIGD